MQHYLYDASGERVLKASSESEAIYENGSLANPPSVNMNSYTTYPSAFMVIDPNGIYSKHYYAGSQRIVSRLGDKKAEIFDYKKSKSGRPEADGAADFDEKTVQQAQISDLQRYLDDAKLGKATFKEYKGTTYQEEEKALQDDLTEGRPDVQRAAEAPAPIYFYHPDHLGTSTFLTDANGVAYQFFLNLPFGETMAEQYPSSYYKTPFKFSGKELDEETGLHYFGARYYDSRSSIWLSVDPLALRYPATNPYVYCFDNPINMIDPDGRAPLWIFRFDSKGNMTVIDDGNNNIIIETSKGRFKPSQVDNSRGSLRGLAKIVAFFASKKGFNGRPVKITSKSKGGAGAHYDRNDDSMTFYYSAFKKKFYDNANNLNSTLNHEISNDGHRGEKVAGNYTYLQHAAVYLNETKSSDFSGTTEDYKASTAFGFAERIFNAKLNGEIGNNQEESIINDFNNSNSHGINIDYKSLNGDGSATISVNGKNYSEKQFERIKEPEN